MIYFGAGLLAFSLALTLVFRAKQGGVEHPLVAGSVVSAVFPTLLLGCIAFGIAVIISGFGNL
jgi:hypothetical protein